MKRNLALTIILFYVLVFFGYSQSKTKIELKENWYHLNGEKFFIKAIGYEIGARPGQHPYEDVKKDEIVITQSYTFSATTNAIMLNNSIPLLVDISDNDLNIDFENLKNFFDKETFTKQNSTYHKKTKKKISCLCLVFTLGLIPDLKNIIIL